MTTPTNDTIHPQLRLLMELQDLRAQHRELGSEVGAGEVEEEHFHIDLAEARDQLRLKIEELEEGLSSPIRARYDRIAPSRDRVVVPVINGVCYGCFVSIPTATAGDRESHHDLQSCEHCGRFLYILP
ncbi:MAG: C4-type zinc ribbon domain-containing protein [Gemmatimonadota bacterium]